MQQLHFTTHVLGKKATARLEQYQVTQTIRAESSSMVVRASTIKAIFSDKVEVDDTLQVILDDRLIGLAQHVIIDMVTWDQLDIDDARRGGFDNRFELAYALKRAGYRFLPLDQYRFYRCQFSWVEGE